MVTLACANHLFASDPPKNVALIIHGGAGLPERLDPETEKAWRTDMETALKNGFAAMKSGGALDGVEAAIKVLEDSPRFNAGKGAVFTRDGTNELDASIMEGSERKAGAVAGVMRIKNPISAARAVMEKSEHVLLIGAGAERYAFRNGLTEVSPRYFWTSERWEELNRDAKKAESKHGTSIGVQGRFGTVGAVARDSNGHLAAGTSTGGMSYKMSGRLGDSPIIGAGTYADDRTCGISCSGHGELFIRHAVAFDISSRMRHLKFNVKDAVDAVFGELPKEEGGVGGLIALDKNGNIHAPYNTKGLPRGTITADGVVNIIIKD
jgi:beta-aspartyl-peptidase (threonine type)